MTPSPYTGDFAVAEAIRDSFNKTQQATGINNELKELLQQLTLATAPIAEQLSAEQAKQLTQDLATFTNEATSAAPRRRWWELSLEGIKDAALAVGSVGLKALELATKVAPLLSNSPV